MSDMQQSDDDVPSGTDTEQQRLGQRLQEARDYLGLSQEFVAKKLGIPRASVSAIETGKRKVSSLELKQLAQLYKRPLSYFLSEEASAQREEPLDETLTALFRTTRGLSDEDLRQVLQFAQFLRHAGRAPARRDEPPQE